MPKAHRRHKGGAYCHKCYDRLFRRRSCPKCGCFARLLRNEPAAVCRKCEAARPCFRCGKAHYAIGKITAYGPVCTPCSIYFREPEPCELCGRLYWALTRVRRFGHDKRLCPQCAQADHATCAACHRHRLLDKAEDGRLLCRKCRDDAEKPCSSCGRMMPAGRGASCEICSWTASLRRRLVHDQAAFSQRYWETQFGEFGHWLLLAVGANKAAITIHRYLSFFLELEKTWEILPAYGELVAHFGAEGLRRARLPMRWLGEARAICPDPKQRQDDSERRRIQSILASVRPATPAGEALIRYHDMLMERLEQGKTTTHSVRLALRPAASLLLSADPAGGAVPDQATLDRYLSDVPGQTAAITGFIRHLNKHSGLDLAIHRDPVRERRMRRKHLEAKLLTLVNEYDDTPLIRRKWILLGLAYFHGVSKPERSGPVELHMCAGQDGGFEVILGGQTYWIPRPETVLQSR